MTFLQSLSRLFKLTKSKAPPSNFPSKQTPRPIFKDWGYIPKTFPLIDPGPVLPSEATKTYPTHSRLARKILKSTFGHDSFRGEQEKVFNRVYNGGNTIAVMPTGGGKSLIYQMLARMLVERKQKGVVVVVSPLVGLIRV